MAETDPKKEIWDSYWRDQSPEYAPHQILIDKVIKHAGSKKDIIIELGAGLGVDAFELAALGYNVVAVDMSRESLNLIRSRSNESGIELPVVLADALAMPFKQGSIDLIYHQGLMEHFKDPEPLLAASRPILKSGGKTLIDVPQTFTLYTLKKKWAMARGRWFAGWETQYTPAKLRHIIRKAGFKVVDFYGRDFDNKLFVRLSNIDTLGFGRFGRPIVPRFIREIAGAVWRILVTAGISNYLTHCIGAVAIKHENSD